jgi:hypothetical protein
VIFKVGYESGIFELPINIEDYFKEALSYILGLLRNSSNHLKKMHFLEVNFFF